MADQEVKQENTGENQRIAGENYYDHSKTYYPNIEHWLYFTPMSDQDKLCIENEKLFKRRFGFQVPEEQRRHVIAIRQRFDLMDNEIYLLKMSGLLTARKGKPTSLCADKMIYISGWVEIIFFPGILLLLAIAVCFSPSSAWVKLLLILLFGSGAFWLGWFYSRSSIKPIRILLQRGFKLGEKYVLKEPDIKTTDQPDIQ